MKVSRSLISNSDPATNLRSPSAAAKGLKIAIDGPAGAGKSTVSKRVAEALDYLYIDTGAMYRAVTWLSQQKHIKMSDHAGITRVAANLKIELRPAASASENVRVFVEGKEISKEIRSQEITRLTSSVSAVASVRQHLVEQQREMAKQGGVVLDGRDIGTVVLPDADLKIFLTASPEVRAKRRFAELRATGEQPDYDALLKDIVERDRKDSNRAIAPLCMADDAVLILTDNMTIPEVVSHIVQLCTQ